MKKQNKSITNRKKAILALSSRGFLSKAKNAKCGICTGMDGD